MENDYDKFMEKKYKKKINELDEEIELLKKIFKELI